MSYEDLKILDELRRNGTITEEEYQREKDKIFNNTGQQQFKGTPLFGMSENSYVALLHISQLAGYITFGLGFFLPLILWLANRENSQRVDEQGKEVMNFILSLIVYSAISFVLCLILIGFVLLGLIVILEIACAVMAAISANNGENYRYPFTIRFLK